ncbi:hypothetical protein L1987_43984 [Smallanthus sonchifolius]|uniref:Uncharacterized protein n=1 Tax=Smallanthus sonchifolius TaxID=185202 RepID=A0ACB9GP52_9ASTR|nr:hypothetical protein L1987_43984 [Smallanthus sonchifolius]
MMSFNAPGNLLLGWANANNSSKNLFTDRCNCPPPPALPTSAKPKSSHPPLKCQVAGTFYRAPAPGAPLFVENQIMTRVVHDWILKDANGEFMV